MRFCNFNKLPVMQGVEWGTRFENYYPRAVSDFNGQITQGPNYKADYNSTGLSGSQHSALLTSS